LWLLRQCIINNKHCWVDRLAFVLIPYTI
jgi:hypothetical protein